MTLINAGIGSILAKHTGALSNLYLLFTFPGIVSSTRRFLKEREAAIRAAEAGDPTGAPRFFLPAIQNGRTDMRRKTEHFEEILLANARTLKEMTTPFPAYQG